MLTIFVISLKQATERRDAIRKQFDLFGYECTVVDGIDGAEGIAHFKEHNRLAYLFNAGRKATTGEIGCYASHKSVWKLCAESNLPVVVLEDDAQLHDGFAEAMELVSQEIYKYGFIRLEPNNRGAVEVFRSNSAGRKQFSIGYCRRYPFCATAYAISPTVARAFIKRSAKLTAPVDVFIKNFWSHRQPLYALSPACAYPGPLRNESYIEQGRTSEVKSSWFKPVRLIFKLWQSLRRDAFNTVLLAFHRKEFTFGRSDHLAPAYEVKDE